MVNVKTKQTSSNRVRWISFWASAFAAWGYCLSVTVANAMLPQIQGDLSASLDQVSWIITASIVAGAMGIPPTPWLAARYGLKNVLLVTLVVFTFSSTMLPFSQTLGDVVFWRVIQALSGAPILVLSQSLTVSIFKGRQRGMAMAIWSVALTTGWSFGPAIGAYIADLANWRMAFLVVSPISLLAIVLCWYFLPHHKPDKALSFDWFAFGSLSVGLVALQIVINRGQRQDWFDSYEIVTLTAIAVVSLVIYTIHSVTSDKRFIRWSIFKDRNLAVAMLLTSISGFTSLAPLVLVPPMLEEIKGLEVVTIGFVVTPRAMVTIVLMLVLGPYVERWDPRLMMGIGYTLYAIGSWMMSNYNMDIGMWEILVPQVLQGASSGFVWLPLFHTIYKTLEEEYRDEASMANMLVYNLISSTGVAVLVVILSRSIQINTEEIGIHITSTRELLRFPQYAGLDFQSAAGAAALHATISQQAVMIGYVNIFWLLTWVALAALPLLLLVPTQKSNLEIFKRQGRAPLKGPSKSEPGD